MAKKDEAVTTEQLQWLLERINASSDPITREQVRTFGHHPGGPMLPPECLAVERLPDTFGTRPFALPPCLDDFDVPVNDLAVSPGDGNLWVATVINGESALRCFGRDVGTPEHEGPSNALRHIALRTDGEGARYFSPHIIGFSYGAPVVRLQMHQTAWADDTLVYIGQGRKFEEQLPTTRTSAIHVTPDYAVLTAHPVGDEYAVYRNGELLFRTQTDIGNHSVITDVWGVADGRIAWTEQFGGLYMRDVSVQESSKKPRAIVHDRNIRDVFVRDGALHYITTGGTGHGANLHRIGDGKIRSVWYDDGHAYHHGFTELPDGRVAYIGETARDGQKCWVVDGVAGPGFDCVTGLLIRQGHGRYWGALGRHLYTMDLPPPALSEAEGRAAA